MNSATVAQPSRKSAADYRRELYEILAQFDRLDEQMRARQSEILRLKLETREMLTGLGASLRHVA